MKKNYKVYDLYDGKETIGYADSLMQVRTMIRQRMKETDDECFCVYAELNSATQKYRFSSYKTMTI